MIHVVLAGLCASFVPLPLLYAASAPVEEVESEATVQMVYVVSGDETGTIELEEGTEVANSVVMSLCGGSNAVALGTPRVMTVVAGAPGENATTICKKVKPCNKSFVYTTALADDKDRGWLGVQIAMVPDALAAQLGTESGGVLIDNVVEGGPADQAGLERHDVIIAMDGDDVPTDVMPAVKMLDKYKPGDTVELTVLRAGKELSFNVELGERAVMKEGWKFAHTPHLEFEDQVHARGRIVLKGEDGEWIVKELGDLGELPGLPEGIAGIMPKIGCRTEVLVDGNLSTMTLSVNSDGTNLAIERKDDGSIIVKRADKDGEESEKTYANMDELKAGDEEAHQFLSETGCGHAMIKIGDGGMKTFDIAIEDFSKRIGDFDIAVGAFDTANESFEDAMEKLSIVLEENTSDMSTTLKELLESQKGRLGKLKDVYVQVGKPEHTFTVNEEGKIEVRIRKDDSELVQVFQDADDLEKRNPDLFEKYDKLMSLE